MKTGLSHDRRLRLSGHWIFYCTVLPARMSMLQAWPVTSDTVLSLQCSCIEELKWNCNRCRILQTAIENTWRTKSWQARYIWSVLYCTEQRILRVQIDYCSCTPSCTVPIIRLTIFCIRSEFPLWDWLKGSLKDSSCKTYNIPRFFPINRSNLWTNRCILHFYYNLESHPLALTTL